MPDENLRPAPDPAADVLYSGDRGRLCRTTATPHNRGTNLAAQAVLECWPIPPSAREEVVKVLRGILTDPGANRRDRAIAARALVAASANNLHALEVALKLREAESVSVRLAELERVSGTTGALDLEPLDDDGD